MKMKTVRAETGAEFEVEDGWEFVEVAQSDSFGLWVLLREKSLSARKSGVGYCPCVGEQ